MALLAGDGDLCDGAVFEFVGNEASSPGADVVELSVFVFRLDWEKADEGFQPLGGASA